MSFLNAFSAVLRLRPTLQGADAVSAAADTTYTPTATGALRNTPPRLEEEQELSTQEKQPMLHGPLVFGWLSDKLSRTGMLQVSLGLSCVGSLWIAYLGPGEVVLFLSLLLYSAVTSSRGTQTQAIIADAATDADRDAAFSVYFLLGFISQPFWVLVTGYLMDKAGFATALT